MTLLQIMPEDAPEHVRLRTTDPLVIGEALAECGVDFRRWPVRLPVGPDTDPELILAAHRSEIDELCARQDLQLVDVARLYSDDTAPGRERAAQARLSFLDEHRHAEDEVRFFVHGRGCFYLHLDGAVHAVVCEAGDLLSVPAGTTHWFDMGERPAFTAVRFFQQADGWIGDFTGSPIAKRFPLLDALLAAQP
ncbi:1,2-dihydroxy-3-keto-5-methylthiopentene dioxygenase [Kitasatospora sp. MAP12-15]|uniref:1,2-dihydroxy-3-keto-5-methylthiopentene dioxygenase n=1 Tax=unclassified Kitasatospora TaxID=2633591 RepID=UPI002476848F|nr:cupin [Kitasatospora sp. MAP12-44]MDH6113707.1 1,2-dihydroxy-3-keto-5-methylthiopentene dioxygenase [Kitasatospora sp. MAP12-44]